MNEKFGVFIWTTVHTSLSKLITINARMSWFALDSITSISTLEKRHLNYASLFSNTKFILLVE
jgi:hypothetical protein